MTAKEAIEHYLKVTYEIEKIILTSTGGKDEILGKKN